MWTLSGFSDEISSDLEEQCRHMVGLGLSHLEFRSAWDTNVVELGPERLRTAAELVASHGLAVSCIGSPVGKSDITGPFDPALRMLEAAIAAAELMGAGYIRVFSFFLPAQDRAAEFRDEVITRMGRLASMAGEHGIILLQENETGTYGDTPERAVDVIASVGSENLKLALDPANFVHAGVAPFTGAYALIRPHLAYVQVKDALHSGESVPAGSGDGQIPELVRALRSDGFDGFFSLEPHLGNSKAAPGFGGYSGPEGFTTAWEAFTRLLTEEKVEFV